MVPWYQGKLDMQARLREVNKDKKVIEYTLFQPGMFMEYAGYPKQISTHVPPMPTVWAVDAARVSTVEGHEDDLVTITTVGDIVRVVRRAIEYEGEWPVVGGIAGHQLTAREFKDIVERVTGKTVKMTSISQADLKAGNLTIEMPPIVHPSIPEEQRAAWHGPGWIGILTAVASGAWKATEEWNDLLPDFKFTSFEDFVRNNWGSK